MIEVLILDYYFLCEVKGVGSLAKMPKLSLFVCFVLPHLIFFEMVLMHRLWFFVGLKRYWTYVCLYANLFMYKGMTMVAVITMVIVPLLVEIEAIIVIFFIVVSKSELF